MRPSTGCPLWTFVLQAPISMVSFLIELRLGVSTIPSLCEEMRPLHTRLTALPMYQDQTHHPLDRKADDPERKKPSFNNFRTIEHKEKSHGILYFFFLFPIATN